MPIIHVADIDRSLGEALTWKMVNGVLYDSITPMLEELFPALKKEFKVIGEDRYEPEAYKSSKIGLYDAIAERYLVIYYPVQEIRSEGSYQDELGTYHSVGSDVTDLSVPMFDIREYLNVHFKQNLNHDQIEHLIKNSAKEYSYNMYYGDSVLYNCLILPIEETLDNLLKI